MITVTSAEKNKIEGQMTSALPLMNGQLDFQMEIKNGKNGRSRLAFKQGQKAYELPIFYLTPSTDDSAWELLTDHMEEEKDCHGVFFIKFNSEQHFIQNATTYALTNEDLYQKNMFSELCRLCSYVDLNPYQMHVFDVTDVNQLYERLSNQSKEMKEEKVAVEKVVKESSKAPVEKIVKEVVKAPQTPVKETVKPPVTTTEDSSLDSDIRALINDCFGIF